MTGVRELNQVRVVSAAPELVNLSVLCRDTQVDVALPLDAPVAVLVPELAALVRVHRKRSDDGAGDAGAQRDFWALLVADGDTPLSPGDTLRTAGVGEGDVLRLDSRRTLTVPTLSDDVVDAAARLNKAAFAGWSAGAARTMAFAGIYLTVAIWVYFLLADAFRPQRAVFVGVSLVVAAAMIGGAALGNRAYGDTTVGAALGWAAVPVVAAVTSAAVAPFGDYVHALACVALLLVLYVVYRVIGTGRWGYLATAVPTVAAGPAFVAQALHVPPAVVAGAFIVSATLACLVVPYATSRLDRFDVRTVAVGAPPGDAMFAGATVDDVDEPGTGAAQALPTADDVLARVRAATLTRSALYTGLAAVAVYACTALLRGQSPVAWSGVSFALVCVIAFASFCGRVSHAAERAPLAAAAVAILVVVCSQAQRGGPIVAAVAFGFVLLAAVAGAAAATLPTDRHRQFASARPYLEYVATAALLPMALWAGNAYPHLGIP